jgi:hypothetical protein
MGRPFRIRMSEPEEIAFYFGGKNEGKMRRKLQFAGPGSVLDIGQFG